MRLSSLRREGLLDVERRDALGRAIFAERDFLDARLRLREQGVATLLQGFAPLIEFHRFVERNGGFLQSGDNLLELLHGLFEWQRGDVGERFGHGFSRRSKRERPRSGSRLDPTRSAMELRCVGIMLRWARN